MKRERSEDEGFGEQIQGAHPDVHFYNQLPPKTHLPWEASPSRNTAALTVLAGYSEIKLRSSVSGNCSLQCFWVSSNSREQDGASLSRYPPRISGSCNGAKSSHEHVGLMLHRRDMLEDW